MDRYDLIGVKVTPSSLSRIMFWACLFALTACYAFTMWAGIAKTELYIYLMAEDGPLENMATAFVLAASVLFALAYVRYKSQRQHLFLVFSLILLFVFFEEISWGQRILGIETPESFKELNAQGELNLHNYTPIYKYVNALVYAGLGLYLIGLPLLVFIEHRIHSFLIKVKIPIPSPATAFLAFVNYFLFTSFFEKFLAHQGKLGQGEINYGELLETGLELALFYFAFECLNRGITWLEDNEVRLSA